MYSEELAPVFVIGSPRSGTSLLRLVLTSHSKIVIPPECGFNLWLYDKYKNWTIKSTQSEVELSEYIDSLQGCKKFDTWLLDSLLIKETILERLPRNYTELSACVYFAYAKKVNKSAVLWGDKNNYYLHHISILAKLYSVAKFLHIVRDGRDIACSYREVNQQCFQNPYAPKLPTDIALIASEWSNNVSFVENEFQMLPAERQKTIRYEDMVNNPIRLLKEVCSWLELEYQPAMLNFHDSNKKYSLEPEQTLGWKKRTLEPISSNTVGRYQEQLSRTDIDVFQQHAESELIRYSYQVR